MLTQKNLPKINVSSDFSRTVVVQFCGDSGDGIQLLGTEFSRITAQSGHDFYTISDFPAEIRSPIGSEYGVSSFQIQFGQEKVNTAGDRVDVLFVFNPAALKVNKHNLKPGGVLFVDIDNFTEREWKKVGYTSNPLLEKDMKKYQIIEVPMTTHVIRATKNLKIGRKQALQARNYWALGVSFFLFQNDITDIEQIIRKKFSHDDTIRVVNYTAFQAGYSYADTFDISYYAQEKDFTTTLQAGRYKSANGIDIIAKGLMSVVASTQLKMLFYSYPITPASALLHRLSSLKGKAIQVFQVEDEIAAITMAIGTSFAGALGVTATSGPGISLMSEGLGLAVMAELPLLVFDIQRAGPSTGMPTKTSQSDLNIALYGRHGEAPCIVLAPSTIEECFDIVRIASQIAIKYMVPVIILADAHLANSMQPWRIPTSQEMVPIDIGSLKNPNTQSRQRDEYTQTMPWHKPSDSQGIHVTGGLERSEDGTTISYEPKNHDIMVQLRAKKIVLASNDLPVAKTQSGKKYGKILFISWGSSFGATQKATLDLLNKGIDVSHCSILSLSPLPKGLEDIIQGFEIIIVVEANSGQLCQLLRSTFLVECLSCTKITGARISVQDIMDYVKNTVINL